ncbi:hypothetical protein D1632_01430 [Chryseobacterium nematophagum]|uniref:Uncharacterized protein n=1 Tax=Chryseobacterium nematophagum TaxID=2305228 RepID=A0A3M7LD81_9FLAO|nr:hypothetical protein [Chryseobacterium nematophagum]RMZ60671.1 hypothetical protein D1632_01430 [Chryseobacterium nematophagum]
MLPGLNWQYTIHKDTKLIYVITSKNKKMTPNKTKIKLTALKIVKSLNKKTIAVTFGGTLQLDNHSTGRDSQARDIESHWSDNI